MIVHLLQWQILKASPQSAVIDTPFFYEHFYIESTFQSKLTYQGTSQYLLFFLYKKSWYLIVFSPTHFY